MEKKKRKPNNSYFRRKIYHAKLVCVSHRKIKQPWTTYVRTEKYRQVQILKASFHLWNIKETDIRDRMEDDDDDSFATQQKK